MWTINAMPYLLTYVSLFHKKTDAAFKNITKQIIKENDNKPRSESSMHRRADCIVQTGC